MTAERKFKDIMIGSEKKSSWVKQISAELFVSLVYNQFSNLYSLIFPLREFEQDPLFRRNNLAWLPLFQLQENFSIECFLPCSFHRGTSLVNESCLNVRGHLNVSWLIKTQSLRRNSINHRWSRRLVCCKRKNLGE